MEPAHERSRHAASRIAGARRQRIRSRATAAASTMPKRLRSHSAAGPNHSRAAPRSMATGRSIRRRRRPGSSPRPNTKKCMTSGSGICGRSATARCMAFPSGKSCARSPPQSRSTRSSISTTTSNSSRRMRGRMACMCIGRATPPSTTASSTASSKITAPSRWSRASRCSPRNADSAPTWPRSASR